MLKRKKEKFNLRKQKGWLAGSSATQTICVSFLLVIAAGTLLLSLPIASKQGRLGLVDALFTGHQRHLRHRPRRAGHLDAVHVFRAGSAAPPHPGGRALALSR